MTITEKIILSELLKTKSFIIALAEISCSEKELESFYQKQQTQVKVCLDILARDFPYISDEIDGLI